MTASRVSKTELYSLLMSASFFSVESIVFVQVLRAGHTRSATTVIYGFFLLFFL